ncbi:MAG: mediator complex subunit [Candelina mexicana]|nr:MAG: mediator complex subunit [Candelina mexicana]
MDVEPQEWTKLLDRCLLARVKGPKFSAFCKALYSKNPISSSKLANIFIKPRASSALTVDPLIPSYIECLLALEQISVPDALRTLLRYSRLYHSDEALDPRGDQSEDTNELYNGSDLEEILLFRYAKCFTTGGRPKNAHEAYSTLKAVATWMSAIVTASTKDEMMQDLAGVGNSTQPEAIAVREAVGMLVVALAENGRVMSVLDGQCPKGTATLHLVIWSLIAPNGVTFSHVKQTFAHALSLYIPFLSQTSLQIANRLASFQKQYNIYENDASKALGDSMMGGIDVNGLGQLQGVDGVLDGHFVNSRAGLYIYFSAVLVGRPLIDDNMVLNYFSRRYKGDISTLAIDLITTSFDLLSNAMYRKESNQTMFLLRSFLVNKIPTMLTTISTSMFPPLTPEYCITAALNHVDSNVFPSSVLGSGGALSDVRPEFVLTCNLHQLIPQESIMPLLDGNDPMGGSQERYIKEELVHQCTTDHERLEVLLGELEKMDGNAGAIVAALTQIIQNLCYTKETMLLKAICSSLSRRPLSLDVMLLFTSSSDLLLPICQVLNNWKFEEDQGEYQPVYEDFGGILLLVLAYVHRYELSIADLGLSNDGSFIARLLATESISQRTEDIPQEQNEHLGGWIRGLFEAEGISDELMSSCPPQEFYLLVPILFSQSVAACDAAVLDLDTLKGGLEYLLETFLLPSLVSAISWLTGQIWESPSSIPTLLQILQILIKPTSISGDAHSMHQTILSLIANPLEQSLHSLRRRDPTRYDVQPLLQALQPFQTFKRTTASTHSELESWTATHGGGLLASIRNTFQSLVLWSAAPEINLTPPSYTHRQLLVAVKLLGAQRVLSAIVDEVVLQTENGSADLALDIGASLISAPTTAAAREGRLGLREVLKLEVEMLKKEGMGVGSEHERAETVVRLSRRVEEALADFTGQQQQVVDDLMGDLDSAAVAAAADEGGAVMGLEGGGSIGLGDSAQQGGAEDLDAMLGVGSGSEGLGIFDLRGEDGALFEG